MPLQLVLSKSAGRLGITCVDDAAGLGAVVAKLIENSVAKKAGLHVGDIITTINGIPVHGHKAAIKVIDEATDRVAFVLQRATRCVVLDKSDGRIGITCRKESAASAGASSRGFGVEVSALAEGSVAHAAGLFVGDTLLSINGELVKDHKHAVQLVDAEQVLEVVVDDSTREVFIDKANSGGKSVGLTVADRLDGGSGVVVTRLQPGGLAIQKLEIGDVILSIEGVLVRTHSEAIAAVDGAKHGFRLVIGDMCDNLEGVLDSLLSSSAAELRPSGDDPNCDMAYALPYEPLNENIRRPSGGHGQL